MYLILARIVGSASNTIYEQQEELVDNVKQLEEILAQNEILNNRIQRAASRTTLLNEQFLRRISADLHDGPVQDLALALLRIDPLSSAVLSQTKKNTDLDPIKKDFLTIQNSLESGMDQIRQLSTGLQLPGIENKPLGELCKRAVRDYEKRTNRKVEININVHSKKMTVPIVITAYRIIQEALMNGFHHTKDAEQIVTVLEKDNILFIDIADSGPGFNSNKIIFDQNLGLSGMRERVEVLGGEFVLQSSKEKGTTIKVQLPIADQSLEMDE